MTSTSHLTLPGGDPARAAARTVRRVGSAPLQTFRTPVRGHAFAARPPGAPPTEVGGPVRLVREPDNPCDDLAVAVWAAAPGPWRIGYLDRAVAARLAPRLDDGQRFRASLEGWIDAPGSRWRRPLLRIEPAGASSPSGPAADRVAPRPPGVRRRTIPSVR